MTKPLIVHVLHSFDTGGMERFVATLIDRTRDRYRHAVVCFTGAGELRGDIERSGATYTSLGKKSGKDWLNYVRLWRVLRRLKPCVVQSYNVGALDVAPIARLAGVRRIVHAVRGRDASDPRGEAQRYLRLHRWVSPFITHFLTVSRDLDAWLVGKVGIRRSKVSCIPNGIDVATCAPRRAIDRKRPLLQSIVAPDALVIVNVGRLDPVKGQASLIEAFQSLCASRPENADRLRLVIVGEGPQRGALEHQIARSRAGMRISLLGLRRDVAALLAECDVFALASVAEGMPGVLLEAMAGSLPVVATNVGGVGEVVVDGETGTLVPPSDTAALAAALRRYVDDPELRRRHGVAGRARVESCFGMQPMIDAYVELYDSLLSRVRRADAAAPAAGLAGRGEH